MKLTKKSILMVVLLALTGCSQPVPPVTHTYVRVKANEPTCTEEGNIAYYRCADEGCGLLFDLEKNEITAESVVVPAKGHDLTHHPEVKATKCLTYDVVEYWDCSECFKLFADEAATTEITSTKGSMLQHNFVDHPKKDATCYSKGNIAYAHCDNCKKIFTADHTEEITDTSYIIPVSDHTLTHHKIVAGTTVEYWHCSMCTTNFADPAGNHILDNINEDKTVHTMVPSNVKRYLAATEEADIVSALVGHNSPYHNQIQKTISWTDVGAESYKVELSTNVEFATKKVYTTSDNSYKLPGVLIPGTRYFYRILDGEGTIVCGARSFITENVSPFRSIYVPGVSNFRDIGGWTVEDGTPIKYGKIFRSGRIDGASVEGRRIMTEELGIKSEIDLRKDGTNVLPVLGLNYLKRGLDQYTMIVPNYSSPLIEGKNGVRYGYVSTSAPTIKQIFEDFANPANYPLFYHCNAGADRTGTITYLLQGLLGVSVEDIMRDFELTSFSEQGNRFRSGVEGGLFVSTGEKAGIYQANSDNYVAFGKLHELISTNYAQPNGKLYSAVEYYLIKVCGVEPETIANVRKILLGDDVEFDTIEVKEDTTFSIENGNWTLNPGVEATVGNFHGKDCTKFITNGDTDNDHYIFNNLALINNTKYSTFHFDLYVPDTSVQWGNGNVAKFHLSAKPSSGSTNNMAFTEKLTENQPNVAYALKYNQWQTYEIDISSYTDLIRFAFYLPLGRDIPGTAEIYVANCYVD